MAEAELDHSDDKLVETAYAKITDIFTRHYHEAIFTVGAYLVETFFDRDFERARDLKQIMLKKDKDKLDDTQLKKTESFYALTKKFSSREVGTPSKSWLYNAVKLAVQENDFESIPEYKDMNVSKKILLFPYSDKTKQKYIPEISPSDVTVNKAKEILPKPKRSTRRGIPYFIKNPNKLNSVQFKKKFNEDFFNSLEAKEKEDLLKKAKNQKDKINTEIDELKKKLGNLEEFENRLS